MAEHETEESPRAVRPKFQRTVLSHVGVLNAFTQEPNYRDIAALPGVESKDRRIEVDGQSYEHVADDADGVWLYRAM